jgi:hypothetical protein
MEVFEEERCNFVFAEGVFPRKFNFVATSTGDNTMPGDKGITASRWALSDNEWMREVKVCVSFEINFCVQLRSFNQCKTAGVTTDGR